MEKAFQELLLRRLDKQDEKLENILVQATRTNGRVTNSEKEVERLVLVVEDLKSTKSRNQGRDKVLGWLMAGGLTGLGALLGYVINHFISKL